jgi:3-oxoadipate enol-lactonase
MPYAKTRLGRLFFEEFGQEKQPDAPALVLLHGLLYDGGMWREPARALEDRARVVVFDAPGHGKSELPPPFSIEDHAEALIDAFDALGIGKAVLAGVSWGGMVSMRLALRHPSRVAGLALFDTSAAPHGALERVRYRFLVSLVRRMGLPRFFIEREIAPLMYSDRALRERPELVDHLVRTMVSVNPEGLMRAALAVAVHRTDISKDVARIDAPTIVVYGSEDRATQPVFSEALVKAIPGASREVIDGAGHMAVLEQPRIATAILEQFALPLLRSKGRTSTTARA